MRIRAQNIDGNLQIHRAVVFRRRHVSIAQVDLQRGNDELRHAQTGIALRSPLHKLLLGRVGRKLLVLGLLFSNGRLVLEFASTWLIIVTDKHPRLIRQGVKLLDTGIQIVRGTTWEIASGRPHIGHKDSITGEDCIANHVADTGWCVARSMHNATFEVSQLEGLAIFEEDIELRPILTEFLFQIEHLLERALDGGNVLADARLSTGEALREAGTSGHVIRMYVRFADVLNVELVLLAEGGNLIVVVRSRAAGGKVEIHYRVDDHGLVGVGIDNDVRQRRGALMVECVDSWFAHWLKVVCCTWISLR